MIPVDYGLDFWRTHVMKMRGDELLIELIMGTSSEFASPKDCDYRT